jgi:eukaryotic-like serine/threonine-protein kinase
MQWLRSVIVEVHRRSLWQVLAIYLVGSWVAYQVVIALTQGVGLPDWVPGLAVVLFVIGLPIVLATAFVQEGVPHRADRWSTAEGAFDPTLFPQVPAPAASGPQPDSAPPPGRLRALLTWRRSLTGGVLAFTLLALFTTGFLSVRALGIGPVGSLRAAGVLAESDRIVIADFESVGGDSAIARLVTETFRVDLARSTLVRPVELAAIRDVLRRMNRDDLPRLDAELAREIALRDGVHLVITGEVTTTGGGHLITVRLVSAETGEVLAALRETAPRDDDLIRAVDRLSRTLRARTGESLRAVHRSEPLLQVTTSSLEALRKYTEARRAIQYDANPGRGRELLQEAVALDTTFAAAWGALAINWSNARDPVRALEAVEKARRHEDRLTTQDLYRTRATYHNLHRQWGAAIATYEQLLRMEPTNIMALTNTGVAYSQSGNHERALRFFERVVSLDSTRYLSLYNLGEGLIKVGRFEDAEREWQRAVELAPFSTLRADIAVLPAAGGDFDAAEARLRALLDDPTISRGMANRAENFLAAILITRGRLAENLQRAASRAERNSEASIVVERFWDEIGLFERPDRARPLLQQMRRLREGSAAQLGRPALLNLARACAAAGELQCAREYLQRADRAGELPDWAEGVAFMAQGELALAEGDHTLALRRVRTATDGSGCAACEQQEVGRVFEAMGQPDSAIAAYERFLDQPSIERIRDSFPTLGPTLLRLAALYEQRGDVQSAARRYAEFIALWERADPELQPRVAEARLRLARLRSDR